MITDVQARIARKIGGLVATLAVTGLVATLILILREELNPDWFGYQLLYEDEGAWLSEQGRDPLFLIINQFFSVLIGSGGYDEFRLILGSYFTFFTFLLLRGGVFRFEVLQASVLTLLLGVLPLAAVRFTVQIREGIALTFVLLGMKYLQSALARPTSVASVRTVLRSNAFTLPLFMAAYFVHAGTLPLLLALFVSWYVCRHRGAHPIAIELRRLRALRYIVCALTSLFAIYFVTIGNGTSVINQFYGAISEQEVTTSFAKYAYWIVFGAGLMTVLNCLHRTYMQGIFEPQLRSYLGVLGFVLLPATYVAAILFLILGAPAIWISSAARVMIMTLSIVILLLALRGGMSRTTAVFSIFLVVDQARIVYKAILSTYTGLYY